MTIHFTKRCWVSFSRYGWYFILRAQQGDEAPIGFLIKPVKRKLFSERYALENYAHWAQIGPLFMRTYKKVSS